MKSLKYFLLLAFAVVTCLPAVAQNGDWVDAPNLSEDMELIIEKDAQLELPQASRNYKKMAIKESGLDGQGNNIYVRNLIDYRPGDIVPDISPLKMPVDIGQPYGPGDNYFKAGFGNFFTTYLEGMYTNGLEGEYIYGAHVKHLASRNGPVDGNNSGSGQNGIDVFGKYFTDAGTLSGTLGYNRQKVHFYGYDSLAAGTEIESDSIEQFYHVFSGNINFDSQADLLSSLSYSGGADFHVLSDNYNASEYSIGLNFRGDYYLMDNSAISFNAEGIFSQLEDTASINRSLFRFGGAYEFDNDLFRFTAGANFAYNAEDNYDGGRFRVYPNIRASYQVLENTLTAWAHLTGGLEQTTLLQLSRENPWVGPNLDLLHTDRQFELSAGVNARPLQNVGLSAEAGYSRLKNLYFLVNNELAPATFGLAYDQGGVNVLHLKVDASVDMGNFRGMLKLGFFNYGVDSLQEAWHRPSMVNNFTGSYNFNDRFFVYTDIYHIGGLRAQGPADSSVIELDNIFDLNLKFDYRIFDNFSAFLSFNNILSQNYERYHRYQVRGFNVLGGITYSFNTGTTIF